MRIRGADDLVGPPGALPLCERCGAPGGIGSAPGGPRHDDPFLAASLAGGGAVAVEPPPAAPPADPAPAAAPAPAPAPTVASGAARGLLALLALVAVAGAILGAALHGRTQAADGGPAVAGLSSVLYETVAGRAVVVVRGELRAGAAPLADPRLDVALVDGDRVVARSSAAAGAVPDPAEVFALDGAQAVDRLAALLAVRARPRLEPGERAPFGAVVAELPAVDPARLRVRVSLAR